MKTDTANNVKLGTFVLLGFLLLLIALFYIGNNNSFFRSGAELKTRFSNVNGLQQGNNVLFSGINAGTVKSIVLIDTRTIEVTFLIKKEIIKQIPVNSKASIGTDGLVGNKVVNITPDLKEKVMVQDGDYLLANENANIEQMLKTLSQSNENIALISEALKNTVQRIDKSEIINLLESKELTGNVQASISNIRMTAENTQKLTLALEQIVHDVHHGKGAAGLLLSDQAFADDLQTTLTKLKETSSSLSKASTQINLITSNLNNDLQAGKGPIPALLRDTLLTKKISLSLENIEKSTYNFNQNMEALKHNFFLRSYFKKQEKRSKEGNK